MATLVIQMPDGASREEPLVGEVTVGRADGNTIILTEGGVSRRHARFFDEGGKVMVEDLGSANGTFVDGGRIEAATEVGARAQVVIGDYEIAVKAGPAKRRSGPRAGPAPAAPGAGAEGARGTAQIPAVKAARATRQLPAVERQKAKPGGAAGKVNGSADGPGAALAKRPSPRPASAPVGPSLRGLTGPWANKVYPLRGKVVVGRVPGVQIQIEDESVSRRHAELERTADGVVVRDLASANGTTVNGHPLEGDTLLQAGDVVQFGMIELSFELGDEEALAAPTRRAGGPAPRASGGRRAGGAEGGAAGLGGKKKLLAIGGAALGLLVAVGVVVKVAGGSAEANGGGSGGPGARPVAPIDPKAEVDRLLAECRSFAATELGTQPNWERARAACEKARELDPINRTVIEQIQKVDREQECQARYEGGNRQMNLLREEEALVEFGKIQKECSYYRIVKPRAREAIEKVKKRAAEDCKNYTSLKRWEEALPRCELYMTFTCQGMDSDALNPFEGMEVDLVGGCKRKKNCWAPKDPMYRNLLLSRSKVQPDAGPWLCMPIEMFKTEDEVVDVRGEVKKAIREWYQEKILIESMELYWDGKSGEAFAKLHRLRADRTKVALHQAADDLRRDIAAVENLYRVGATLLKDREFEKCATTFKDALELDTKLMREMVEKKSFYRTTIEVEMAKESYQGGKHWADRRDYRRACKIWKIGFDFYRGNGDLNRAMGSCSQWGGEKLAQASRCDDLTLVLDLAVDGDGLKDRVAKKAADLGCKP